MSVRILCGHVLDWLRALPDNSVHCVVTSPPYWGLRDYGTSPVVFGGELGHTHAWDCAVTHHKGGPHGNGVLLSGGRNVIAAQAAVKDIDCGSFCECGAWRGNYGLEPAFPLFIEHTVEIFREVRRVLRADGTLWLNLGDCYAGSWNAQSREHGGKHARNVSALEANRIKAAQHTTQTGAAFRTPGLKAKDLIGMPWRVAFALQADGWWLRSDIIWAKPNPMPSSVKDRPTPAKEYLFLLTKSARYYYDDVAIMEPIAESSAARYAQPTVAAQEGGAKQDAYESGFTGSRASSRRPNEIIADTALRFQAGDPSVTMRAKRDVWTIPTEPFPGEHFATFPMALVEPCIKAGTSERGVCARCAAPTKRIVARGKGAMFHDHEDDMETGHRMSAAAAKAWKNGERTINTVGFAPTCECPIEAGTVPATVLDPFGGSGTMALVADRLGRDAILIEIKPEYAEMARARLVADQPLLAEVDIQ